MLQRMLEEELYFNCVYFNWQCDDGFAAVSPKAFAVIPWYLRWALGPKIRADRLRDLKGQVRVVLRMHVVNVAAHA